MFAAKRINKEHRDNDKNSGDDIGKKTLEKLIDVPCAFRCNFENVIKKEVKTIHKPNTTRVDLCSFFFSFILIGCHYNPLSFVRYYLKHYMSLHQKTIWYGAKTRRGPKIEGLVFFGPKMTPNPLGCSSTNFLSAR